MRDACVRPVETPRRLNALKMNNGYLQVHQVQTSQQQERMRVTYHLCLYKSIMKSIFQSNQSVNIGYLSIYIIYLSISLSVCLSVDLSVLLSIHPSIHPSIHSLIEYIFAGLGPYNSCSLAESRGVYPYTLVAQMRHLRNWGGKVFWVLGGGRTKNIDVLMIVMLKLANGFSDYGQVSIGARIVAYCHRRLLQLR